jgi:hypothetical protein
MTRDTVVLETPASLAISLIVYDITLSQRCAQNYASKIMRQTGLVLLGDSF